MELMPGHGAEHSAQHSVMYYKAEQEPQGALVIFRLRVPARARIWLRRYLPSELLGTLCALLFASEAFRWSGSGAVAALAGTWGENLAYYGLMLARDLNARWREQAPSGWWARLWALGLTLRNIVLEFGLAEALDSFLLRPTLMYLAIVAIPQLQLAIVVGKLAADVTFYVPTIIAFELRTRFLDRAG